MGLFGIGKKAAETNSCDVEQNVQPFQLYETELKPRERLAQAIGRVADLDARLSVEKQAVIYLEARLKDEREAAIEAATRGEEPPSLETLETDLRTAQGRAKIFEEALGRSKRSLQIAEAENVQAAQAERDEKFANILREMISQARKLADCHQRLREIQTAAGGQYPADVLWPAFGEAGYAGWLESANSFLNRPEQGRQQQETSVAHEATVAHEAGVANDAAAAESSAMPMVVTPLSNAA
jgi:hypothetical protein